MRLVVDLQGAQTESCSPESRFSPLSFARALARNRGEHDIIVVLSDAFSGTIQPIRRVLRELLPTDAVRVWTAPRPISFSGADNKARRTRAETIHGAFLASLEPDVILVACPFAGYYDHSVITAGGLAHSIPIVAVHNDLTPFQAQDGTDGARVVFLEECTEALKRVDLVLATADHYVSHAVSQLGLDSSKIMPIHAACLEDVSNAECAAAFSWDQMASNAWAACEGLAARRAPAARSRNEILRTCVEAIARTRPDERDLDALAQALAFNFPEPNRARRIFVDVSRLYREDVRTGIQRVARSILLEWLDNPPDGLAVEPIFAQADRPGYCYAWSYVARLAGGAERGPDAPIDYAAGDIFFGLDLSPYIGVQKTFLERMHAQGVRILFVVHDLLPVDMPENFSPTLVENFQEWLREIARFDGIIAVSEATARTFRTWRLANNMNAGPEDDFVYAHVHCGADIENSAPTTGLPSNADDVLSRLAARPSFLMVSTLEPRKGHEQALDAMEKLWGQEHDINLVIVGKQGWLVERLAERLRNHREAGERLHWLAGISDEYLAKVYNVATCALVNSAGEGFGLPLIEAARHKVPLLVRDLPVFREVAGEHARYFTAPTAGALAEVIEAWLEDHRRGNVPSSDSMPWLTWKESARRMADILLHADGTQQP